MHDDKGDSGSTLHETVRLTEAALDASRAARHRERPVSLLVYQRDRADIVLLRPDEPLVLGRDPATGVGTQNPDLSREHARFQLKDGVVTVEDLGSTNGTWIDGKRAASGVVKPGHQVAMGDVDVFVHLPSPSEGEILGLDSHERFRVALEDEVARARHFGRPFSVFMVRSAPRRTAPRAAAHVSGWSTRVRAHLRAIDRAALYSSEAIEILLPELGGDAALEIARAIAASRGEDDAPLLVGWALFPEAATDAESLMAQCRSAVQRADAESPVQAARAAAWAAAEGSRKVQEEEGGDEAPVVESAVMKNTFEAARRAAVSPITVLLRGETGSGKEVVARAIHAGGPRSRRPMLSVNCGAIPGQLLESTLFGHVRGAFTGAFQDQKGVFEAADGGTVLLDEIGELPSAAQAALLRVLDSKRVIRVGSTKEIPVNVRVIAATHRDLEAMCEKDTFRTDLLFRLEAMPISVPPLRERADEIEPLARRFLRKFAKANNRPHLHDFDAAALALLRGYLWPGNVRELRNAVERAVVIASQDIITKEDLPERVRASAARPASGGPSSPVSGARPDATSAPQVESLKVAVRRFENELLVAALDKCAGNQTEAAKLLQIPLRTLAAKLKRNKIKRPPYTAD